MELARAKRELAQVKIERDFLKKSDSVLYEGVATRYAVIKEMQLDYSIPWMCRIFKVAASGYYAWLKRKPSKRAQEEGRLEVEIKAAHKRTGETCGPERLQRDLAGHGVKVSVYRIKRIRKKLGIRCKRSSCNGSHEFN